MVDSLLVPDAILVEEQQFPCLLVAEGYLSVEDAADGLL